MKAKPSIRDASAVGRNILHNKTILILSIRSLYINSDLDDKTKLPTLRHNPNINRTNSAAHKRGQTQGKNQPSQDKNHDQKKKKKLDDFGAFY
jgi:hypothetical protein